MAETPNQPTIVFLVVEPDYESDTNIACFSTMALAEAFVAGGPADQRGNLRIEPTLLDPAPGAPTTPGAYGIQVWRSGGTREYWSWSAHPGTVYRLTHGVEVYGRTLDEARQLAVDTLASPQEPGNG